jgi:hypothetical protein
VQADDAFLRVTVGQPSSDGMIVGDASPTVFAVDEYGKTRMIRPYARN